MQIISMTGEYALLAMLHLAMHRAGAKADMTVEEISRATGIPLNFLSKIMVHLAKAGLVRSYKGRKGGCSLARAPEEITALEILEAVEGPIRFNRCTRESSDCKAASCCPFYSMWAEAQEGLEKTLRRYTLHALSVCIQGLPEEERFGEALRRQFARPRSPAPLAMVK